MILKMRANDSSPPKTPRYQFSAQSEEIQKSDEDATDEKEDDTEKEKEASEDFENERKQFLAPKNPQVPIFSPIGGHLKI